MDRDSKVKKNFGFGCMRLPLVEGTKEIDVGLFKNMVDTFISAGFNYFDTAAGYMDERSEASIKLALVDRHPRKSYVIADKLTANYFEKEEDIEPFFKKQLERVGVEYFDYYLMHAQGVSNYEKFKRCNAYKKGLEFKKKGWIRHFGISFHSTAEYLEKILTENPEIEFVQIQANYADWEDSAVQSRKCYELCRKFDKPIIVMEPVKGGNLSNNLPPEAKEIVDSLGISPASLAFRFLAEKPGIFMILSGMSTLGQVEENTELFNNLRPLKDLERAAIDSIVKIFKSKHLIACTACRYCTAGCPKEILIPDLFSVYNTKKLYGDWNADYYYSEVYTKNNGKASDCIKCGKCEKVCPQHLEIRKLLEDVKAIFENSATN